MDLATLLKPILTAGDLRVIGSTTFEEFKQIEKDRALARRLQKIAIDEPSIEETITDPRRAAQPLRGASSGQVHDAALEAAAKLASRHLRDYRLPDSAIDLIDEAGAVVRLGVPRAEASRDRAGRRVADIERVVARMARIPARQASASDRERLRTLEESLERVVFGQTGGRSRRGAGDQAVARRPEPARSPGRLLPVHRTRPASARPSWPSSSRFTSATSSCAST